MARLNDTRALTERPPGGNEEHSVSVRKIDNGYLTRTSTFNGSTGEYRCAEQFSERPPRITAPQVGRGGGGGDAAGSRGLSGTKKYLGD